MVADVLATQGARESATMVFTMFNRINQVQFNRNSCTLAMVLRLFCIEPSI